MVVHSSRKSVKRTVFVSYSHKTAYLKNLLATSLADDLWEVVTDGELVKAPASSEGVHRTISRLMNRSLFIMPIITKEWLDSQETRDELIRAHERRKVIVPLVHSSILEDSLMHRLPFFLRETPFHPFDENNIGEVGVRALAPMDVGLAIRREELLDYLRILGDVLTDPDAGPHDMQVLHAESVLERAKRELQRIWVLPHDLNLCLTVGHSEAFLSVAAPYFDGAESIDAISLSRVSDFWVSAADGAKDKYLKAHKKGGVRRLFVFRNGQELFAYQKQLDRHLSVYGRTPDCAVFVTDLPPV